MKCSNCGAIDEDDSMFVELPAGTEQPHIDQFKREGGAWIKLAESDARLCPLCCFNIYMNSAMVFSFADPDHPGTWVLRSAYAMNRVFAAKEPSLRLQYCWENAVAAIQELENATTAELNKQSAEEIDATK